MEIINLNCKRCSQIHEYKVDINSLTEKANISFACLNIKRLPKLTMFRIDFTKNAPDLGDDINLVSARYGSNNIEQKIKRKNEINDVKLWIIYDFDTYFEEIADSYIIGSFYPVATSCTTLAERLVNLFIIKMRDMYDKSLLSKDLEKYVYTRSQNWQSFENNMEVLKSWSLINADQKKWFKTLIEIRNRAVHYQTTFNPDKDALEAIRTIHKIIDSYFSPLVRKDILRVFEIPGEVWVKENCISDPFVQAFVMPCCSAFASTGTLNIDNIYHENDGIAGIFSEEEFIKQRKEYKFDLGIVYKPEFQSLKIKSKEFLFRIF